ncbi:RNA polymerase sigma factor SigJ [Promicromonospora sukumoe]|uniref:RNA polymerase sigma factor SigJ n=1 Tax=Promicromonospora sukumoe TaxID=88382 RepID=UPI00035CE8C3|nr:RNA polymerase sigma factor SigJ [Promicromonospora sukumoe]
MPDADLALPFTENRRLLFTVAYEMLGAAADAEDVVQEAWLRWSAKDRSDVDDPRAYLVRITTRLALNRLRTLRRARETYVGPWLPDPILTTPDAALPVERAEEVSLALLVVLETLSPVERAVFVLREVFDLSYQEIADVLDREPATVRQTAHRAREHVRARRPRYTPAGPQHAEATERFLAACFTGDVAGVLAALAPEVELVTDGGGVVRAARRVIRGADKVSRALVAFAGDATVGRMEWVPVEINGALGMLALLDGEPAMATVAEYGTGDQGGLLARVMVFRNPERLAGLRRLRD